MSLNVTINQVLKSKYYFTGSIINFIFNCIITVSCINQKFIEVQLHQSFLLCFVLLDADPEIHENPISRSPAKFQSVYGAKTTSCSWPLS
jgi:hypothetical protein